MSEPNSKKRKTPESECKKPKGGGGNDKVSPKPQQTKHVAKGNGGGDSKDKAPRKQASKVFWGDSVRARARELAKEYRRQFGQWLIDGHDKDEFPAEDTGMELFRSFKPFTKFDPYAAREFVQAIREWQYMAEEMRGNNIPLEPGAEGLDEDRVRGFDQTDLVADGLDNLIDLWSGTGNEAAAAK